MKFSSYRRLVSLCFTVLLLLSAATTSHAQSGRPITEHGLEQSLKLGGLQESELIALINRRGVDFFLDAATEKTLTGVGATPAILEAVRGHYRGADGKLVTSTTTPGKPTTASPVTPHPAQPANTGRPGMPTAPGIYVQRAGAWTPLHQESVDYVPEGVSKVFGKASGGLLKLRGDVNGELAGNHSTMTVTAPATFFVRMAPGLSSTDYLLVHTHAKHDNREFRIATDTLRSKDNVGFRLIDVSGNTMQLEVAQGAGDYAFVDVNSQPDPTEPDRKAFLYTFQITQ